MHSQPPSTPSSQSFPASIAISRPALVKALTLLVFLWLLAAFSRSYGSDVDNQTVSQETADHVVEVGSDEKGTNGGVSQAPQPYILQQHTDRAAVIVENRPLENLIPVILHFHSVLGPEWPLIFYTTPTTSEALMLSAPFSRAVDEQRVVIRHLPPEVSFGSHRAVSLFLADPWIWEELAPYKKVLMFQADSIICSSSSAKVEDFLEYDLIGAPINNAYGRGFNGGLSIRNRELVLDLVSRYSYANDSSASGAPREMQFEDQWLYTRMSELLTRQDGKPVANLPSYAAASKFAVETIWEEEPLGFHQPVRWQKENMEKIMKYCPEVGMTGGAAFF
ncbi:hypothetical protein BJ170DRAFT_350135 [Xylariales sp. AK1849]|nr:hypothetical protein BJ170DRAFT_350135 [Xylariales sp. AK1849]